MKNGINKVYFYINIKNVSIRVNFVIFQIFFLQIVKYQILKKSGL